MFWFNYQDEDDIPDERSKPLEKEMSYRLQDILTKMRQIKRQRVISLADQNELDKLEKELEDLRSRCLHSYETVLLFHTHRRFCRWCDAEDHEYRHQD